MVCRLGVLKVHQVLEDDLEYPESTVLQVTTVSLD